MGYMDRVEFSILKGKTLKSVKRVEDSNEDILLFETTDGEKYRMYHSQDCCESALIEDIDGDLQALIGDPLLMAEEVSYCNEDEERPEGIGPKCYEGGYCDDSWTWTFYKLATIKGSVTIRWYGKSNGYYSERVDFEKIEDD